jgi:hypothetical protein
LCDVLNWIMEKLREKKDRNTKRERERQREAAKKGKK